MSAPRNSDVIKYGNLAYLAVLARNYAADVAKTCASLISSREATANKTTTITSASTDDQYPSAKAVWTLFNAITNANEVSY